MSINYDVVVVGCGPAGMAAAIEAASWGAKTAIFDENHRPGGQLFKQIHKFFGSRDHYAGFRGFQIAERLLEECRNKNVDVFLNAVVYGIEKGNKLGVVRFGNSYIINANRIILATGACENSICFPGWDLPGVMGAGAFQTLMNIERILPGKRLLMVGSGNVGLIVSYQALQAGADVVALVDLAPTIGGYGVHAAKLARFGVPIYTNSTIERARGEQYVTAAIVRIRDELRQFDTDVVCLSVGLRPATELARIAGCQCTFQSKLGYGVVHNRKMETTINTLYVAGDICGIEEASTAIEEGKLSGLSAAHSLGLVPHGKAIRKKKEIGERLSELRY
jgi:thioredoxin reductase